jgi:hypothetical protein
MRRSPGNTTFQVASSDSQFGSGNSYDDTPHLAVAGNEALIVWADADNGTNDIKGRRITADGALLGSDFGFTISGAAGPQFQPSVAWTGSEYVVSWLDHRDAPFPVQPRGDVYAARVSANGTVLDGDGFAIANSAAPEEQPNVTSANGTTIVSYSAMHDVAPFGAMRIATRLLSAPAAPTFNAAASRLTHGSGETYSMNMPLGGGAVESRNGGGNYAIVFTFDVPVNGGTASASGAASVANVSFSGTEMIVALSGVADQQIVTVTAKQRHRDKRRHAGVSEREPRLPHRGREWQRNVDAGDAITVRNRSGQTVNATNYRADVNRSGSIDVGDTTIVRSRSGNSVY